MNWLADWFAQVIGSLVGGARRLAPWHLVVRGGLALAGVLLWASILLAGDDGRSSVAGVVAAGLVVASALYPGAGFVALAGAVGLLWLLTEHPSPWWLAAITLELWVALRLTGAASGAPVHAVAGRAEARVHLRDAAFDLAVGGVLVAVLLGGWALSRWLPAGPVWTLALLAAALSVALAMGTRNRGPES